MIIEKIHITNYKVFKNFDLTFNDDLNILVGDNETGKSTLLEAINLALTGLLNGRQIINELSPYLFNKSIVEEYKAKVCKDQACDLPKILIEVYFKDDPALARFKGSINSKKETAMGCFIEIFFDEDYRDEYQEFLGRPKEINTLPTEYYTAKWYSFANNLITSRGFPINSAFIDTTTIRLQSGTDYYIQNLINKHLEPKERVGVSIAYRQLKESFSGHDSIQAINDKLKNRSDGEQMRTKSFSISLDTSQKANWETNLASFLDEIPFQYIGKGEQSILKMLLALEKSLSDSHIILIEEPENHLSYSTMQYLISQVSHKCEGKQLFLSTHSTFVCNKLGMEKVIMLGAEQHTFPLASLSVETYEYFKKLPGYDTLRLVVSRKALLVEGPSDELIIQKAYYNKYKRLPLEDKIDVISVRGLSFLRFLEIGEKLKKTINLITDNDSDYVNNIEVKYRDYLQHKTIKIFYSKDNSMPSLEEHFLTINGVFLLNKVFGTKYASEEKENMLKYMKRNKTDWALKVFNSISEIQFPQYINDAIQE